MRSGVCILARSWSIKALYNTPQCSSSRTAQCCVRGAPGMSSFPVLLGDWEVKGQLTPPAPLGCNTAGFKLTHESGVNSSCSLLFIGEQMRDSISSARWTQLTLRLGSHTTPAARLWLGVGAASQLSSVLFAHLKDAALPALLWAAYGEPLACVLFLHCCVLRMQYTHRNECVLVCKVETMLACDTRTWGFLMLFC